MKLDNKFKCSKCGLCCSHLYLFGNAYKWLDDGNGVCKYFNNELKICSIYEIRPIICRVEEGYYRFFKKIPYDRYIQDTKKACRMLQKMFIKAK